MLERLVRYGFVIFGEQPRRLPDLHGNRFRRALRSQPV